MTDDYLDGWWDACNGIASLLESMPMHVEGRSYFTLAEFQHAENPPLPFVRVPAIQEANNAQ